MNGSTASVKRVSGGAVANTRPQLRNTTSPSRIAMTTRSKLRFRRRLLPGARAPLPTSSTSPSGVSWNVHAMTATSGKPQATAIVAAVIVQFGTGNAPDTTSTICRISHAATAYDAMARNTRFSCNWFSQPWPGGGSPARRPRWTPGWRRDGGSG